MPALREARKYLSLTNILVSQGQTKLRPLGYETKNVFHKIPGLQILFDRRNLWLGLSSALLPLPNRDNRFDSLAQFCVGQPV